jgi:hypothetical protein
MLALHILLSILLSMLELRHKQRVLRKPLLLERRMPSLPELRKLSLPELRKLSLPELHMPLSLA